SVLVAGGTTAYLIHSVPARTPSSVAAAPIVVAAAPPTEAAPVHHAAPTTAPTLPDPAHVFTRPELAALNLDHGPSRGPANAPVTLVAFQDTKCHHSHDSLQTLDQLAKEYPDKLRIVVKQFVVHPTARLSAEALYAADAQGKFWDMHDAIFAHQD